MDAYRQHQHKHSTFSEAVGENDPAATTDCTASLATCVAALEAACTASGMPSMAGTAQLGIMPGCREFPLSLSSMLCETGKSRSADHIGRRPLAGIL